MPGITRDAPYQQVAAHYRAEIKAGRLLPGSELPSLRGLMAEWDIARSTAQRVLTVLRHEGWIVTRPGKPSVVAKRQTEQAGDAETPLSRTVDNGPQ